LREVDSEEWGPIVKPAVLALRLWNGEPGKPTVMHIQLPGGTWDGTSCFNFCKEMLARYCGDAPTDFFKATALHLKPESAMLIDSKACFWRFLLRQPYTLFVNLSGFVWNLVCTQKCFGGAGVSMEVVYFNFDEKDSARLAAGAKKLGMKPFSAFCYAGVKAYREVLGENPHSIIQQASLQTRHYEPLSDRTLAGDWLLGPVQHVGSRQYGPKEAHAGYETLLSDLDNLGPSVMRSLEAKAWGVVSGGASLFEALPTYNDDQNLMNSIFFNNYGVRTVNPDCGFYSFNWQAPFKLGFNTINVNGKTCTGLATGVLGIDKLKEIRVHVLKTLTDMME